MLSTGPWIYAELLLFLAGTVLYGFLVRELMRRPDVLPGNRPLRALAAALLLWYSGTLLDLWLVFLLGPLPVTSTLGAVLDVARGLGWLLAPPLLLHALERIDSAGRARSSPVARGLVALGYAGLLLFAGPIVEFLGARSPYLIEATSRFYPRLVLHMALSLLPASWLALRLAGQLGTGARSARMGGFLRALARLLPALVALFALGLLVDPWSAVDGAPGRILRLAILGGLLLPGLLFAFHVQRYNLLRLSLSNRFLRLLTALLAVVLLVMLSGPALGADHLAIFRSFVAWGLLLALAWSGLVRFVLEPWVERSAALRVFLGRAVTAPRLEQLMVGLESLEGDDRQLMDATADALSRWLGTEACFLPRTLATEGLWRQLEGSKLEVAHRLRHLPSQLGRELDRHDLHAVFALRVAGELRGVLGLAASVTGGAHDDGELEAVRLVLRQLAASLALRAVAERRVEEERRAGEQERLGMLGLVSASLAHEIKNPLSSIKVLAQALREDLATTDPDGEGAVDLEVIVEQIDRLDRTAREILGFARPRAGERTDLVALVSSAAYVLRAEARKRAVVLEVKLGVESLEVEGSPAAWQTIVFNLLKNAVDHAPGGGLVRARLEVRAAGGGDWVFEVVNPGHLDPGVAPRLFEPFVSAKEPGEGTGLGLALVARRAAEVGAELEAREEDGHVIMGVYAATEDEAS